MNPNMQYLTKRFHEELSLTSLLGLNQIRSNCSLIILSIRYLSEDILFTYLIFLALLLLEFQVLKDMKPTVLFR